MIHKENHIEKSYHYQPPLPVPSSRLVSRSKIIYTVGTLGTAEEREDCDTIYGRRSQMNEPPGPP